jgi:hypothetical protein
MMFFRVTKVPIYAILYMVWVKSAYYEYVSLENGNSKNYVVHFRMQPDCFLFSPEWKIPTIP